MTKECIGKAALIDVILNRVKEYPDNCLTNQLELKRSLKGFLEKKISLNDLTAIFLRQIGSDEPVQYLVDVISISPLSEPLNETKTLVSGTKNARKVAQFWRDNEDKRLLAAIYYFGPRCWNSISSFVGNGRTSAQCLQRWKRGLNPIICKEKFSDEEDKKLMDLVSKHGDKSWAKIAESFGNRSDVQCRCRYKQLQKRTAWSNPTLRQSETPMASPLPAFPPFMSPLPAVPAYYMPVYPMTPPMVVPVQISYPDPVAVANHQETTFLDEFLTKFSGNRI